MELGAFKSLISYSTALSKMVRDPKHLGNGNNEAHISQNVHIGNEKSISDFRIQIYGFREEILFVTAIAGTLTLLEKITFFHWGPSRF